MATEHEVIEYAHKVQAALTDLGLAHRTRQGEVVPVSYKRLALAGDRYALLEVDTARLPPRVSVGRLESPGVLQHLSAVVGKPVRRLNTVGLTYVILLQPAARAFPERASLPGPPANLAYAWPLGVTCEGQARWVDLLDAGHMLIGGKPGAGKSTFIHAGLRALLGRHGPEALLLALIDPKAVELSPYAGLPHLRQPVAVTAEAAAQVIAWAAQEMDRREAQLAGAGARHFREAAPPLPLLLIVADELTDLVIQWGGPKSAPFQELIRLSSKGRVSGVALCLATQHPKAAVLDTLVRENCGLRVAFKVDTASQSRCILGRSGAEALPAGRPGRLVVEAGGGELEVLQGFVM